MRASDVPVCCAFLGDSWWLEAFLFGHAASVVMEGRGVRRAVVAC
jgi:hypothetical protein